jgi:hypothetical protein
MLIPMKLRNSVCVRDNVEINLQCLNKPERKELWRAMYKLTKTSTFFLHNSLQHYLRLNVAQEVVVYGAIIRSSFMAVVKIVKQKLFLLSVICKRRLLGSSSSSGCVLVDDVYQTGPHVLRVFSGVDEQKNVVWRWEGRHQQSNAIFCCGGEIVHFAGQKPQLSVAS